MSENNPSLADVEGRWAEAGPGASPLVAETHALRQVPMRDLDPNGLRLLIGQNIGVMRLMPFALDALEADPWRAAGQDSGDLALAVLLSDQSLWPMSETTLTRISGICDALLRTQPEAPVSGERVEAVRRAARGHISS